LYVIPKKGQDHYHLNKHYDFHQAKEPHESLACLVLIID